MIVSFSLIEVFNNSELNFRGNIAAVVRLPHHIDAEQMQRIANDFSQPATAFIWPGNDQLSFNICWFAPDCAIGLCGHGSVAAVASLGEGKYINQNINLHYKGGVIKGVNKGANKASIHIEAIPSKEQNFNQQLSEAFGTPIVGYFKNNNKDIVLLKDEKSVKSLEPNLETLRKFDSFGYIVTAPGDTVDFVSRTFVPFVNQLEDPATGSSHAALVPFWAEKLNKSQFIAHQLSNRGGYFECEIKNQLVTLSSNYTVFAEGQLSI